MMRLKKIFALLAVLLLLFSSCKDEIDDEPVVSASVTESPTFPEESTASPETSETNASETEETTSEVPKSIENMTAREILELSESLVGSYSSYVRSSRTDTEINILGETSKSSVSSELLVSEGNASFTRGDTKYYLIGSELCFDGSLAKYRVGGHDMTSFLSLIGDSFPLSDFDGGSVLREGGEIALFFDTLGESGNAYLRSMLALNDTFSLDIKKAELTVRTDSDGNMKENTLTLELSVGKSGSELMTVTISSHTEQTNIGNRIYLVLPDTADYISFPDIETVSLYEAAFADYVSFTSSYNAYEYTEKDKMTISADGLELSLTSKTDYAYASRIGASIDKTFDIADGTGAHTLLTHFNNKHGFSQIDGGNIFVDTAINNNNLSLTLFHPFETSVYQIGRCIAVESAADGKITLTLNDETALNIAKNILLHAGIPASDLKILELERANTFIAVGEDGKVESAGYSFAASVETDGKTYALSREISLELTSRGTAKVKVIYIEVEEEECN